MDPTVVALIGTIMGGVGLKAVEHWLSQGKVKVDDATRLRDELRMQITDLRADNQQLEKSVDEWREKYYDAYERIIGLETTLKINGVEIPPELTEVLHPKQIEA